MPLQAQTAQVSGLPLKPLSRWAWRRAWLSLTKERGLAGLRPHGMRPHAITRLAESEASEQTIIGNRGTRQPGDAGALLTHPAGGGAPDPPLFVVSAMV
ncbi:MAG: hypothetical protein ABSG70_17450 [Terriglobales bacterium]